MKKIIITLLCLYLALLNGCTPAGKDGGDSSYGEKAADYSGRASAGIWISYSEINSMLKSENGFKAEFDKALDNCESVGTDEIYVHVRAFCDSLYKSEFFPQTAAARELDYDPLEYITEKSHERGIKVHAWINPYRVQSGSEDITALDPQSPAYIWLTDDNTDNDVNVLKCSGIYLNPAEYEVRELVIDGVREILEKYDVDGIHFDDYFYPSDDPELDGQSYEKYTEESENPLPLDDWRRANVNALISGVYTAVKFHSKDTVFSVSPAASVENNYSRLFADVKSWIESGCVDCIIPQLYFGFSYPDDEYKFENLLEQWTQMASCGKGAQLKIGLAFYKTGTDQQPDSEEWGTSDDIIARQAEICRDNGDTAGYVLFSYSSVFSDGELNIKQRENLKKTITQTEND